MPPVLSGPTVTTQWLADHLGSDDLVILDATVLVVQAGSGTPAWISGRDRYLLDGHLPGAVFADLIGPFSAHGTRSPFARPDAASFERAAASVGVTDSSTVVVYDSAGGLWAARLWWLFRSYGFESIAVLDGGLRAWLTEDRETDIRPVKPRPGSIAAVAQPEQWADTAEVDRVIAAGRPPPRPRRQADRGVKTPEGHTSVGTRHVKFSQR
ncbi:MAG: rhodanese-like domain-containing protein [Mycetocola sp.]